MSWQASTWATKARVGDSTLKLLLLMLSNYANEAGECWHSQKRIAYDTEIPERTLRRKLDALVALGFIEIVPRHRDDGTKTTNLIRLLASGQPEAKVAAGERVRTPVDSSSGQKGQRPKSGVTGGQKGGAPEATWVAGQDSKGIPTESSKETTRARADAFFVERFWPAWPRRLGGNPKEAARLKFVAAVASGENPDEILAGVARLVQDLRAVGKLGTETVPMAKTWLHQKRWKDDPSPDPIPGRPPPQGGPRPQRSLFGAALEIGRRGDANQGPSNDFGGPGSKPDASD